MLKLLTSVGTQTEQVLNTALVPPVHNNLVVKIKRLDEAELKKLLNKQQGKVTETGRRLRSSFTNHDREPSTMFHPHFNIRQSLSRLPTNYSHFVRPINNREVANSTVVNITHSDEESTSSRDFNWNTARFFKPGPKSYKLKMFRKLQKLRAPVALSTPKDAAVNCNGILSAVAEANTDAYVTTPVVQHNVSVNVHEVPIRSISSQTEDDKYKNATVIELCPSGMDEEHIADYDFSNISLKTPRRGSNKSGEDEEDAKQNAKYIRINAQTVHIHNHFYKL